MGQLVVRNLDETVLTLLKLRAQENGVSMEQAAREILTAGVTPTREEIAARAAAIRAKQPLHTTSAAELIREDRNR